MSTIGERILQLFFPITCTSCGEDLPADDHYRLCGPCGAKITLNTGLVCQKCGVPLPSGGAHCYRCRKNTKTHYAAIRSAAAYDGVLRDLLHKFKYMNRDYLDEFFGAMLVDALTLWKELPPVDAVAAVPLHWTKRLMRGYNQAELLAEKVSLHTGKPLLRRVLSRRRRTKAQYRLSREERRENLRGTFAARGLLKGTTILLIDDICTTGATIDACAAALKEAGARQVYGLTVARDG